MRIRTKFEIIALLVVIWVSASGRAAAQMQQSNTSERQTRAEVALDYNYIRANAPPGECGCFGLNGGSATFAWTVKPASHFSIVGDIGATHADSISRNKYDMTLGTFTVGGRYKPLSAQSSLQPFAQVLIGVAHAHGSLVTTQNSSGSDSANAFASLLGGGLDLRVSRHVSVRLLEANYLITTFNNNVNSRQNNFRIGAGIIFRF